MVGIMKSLTKEFEGIIKELGLKFMAYRRGGELVVKAYIPDKGWLHFIDPYWFRRDPKGSMALFLQEQLRTEIGKRLNWKPDAYGRLQGNYISVAIYVTTRKTVIVDFYLLQSEKPVTTVRIEKLDLQQLEQLLKRADAWGML
jgi:hypothetical protein